MIIFWIIITLNQIGNFLEVEVGADVVVGAALAAVAMIWVLPLILLSVSRQPPPHLSRHRPDPPNCPQRTLQARP